MRPEQIAIQTYTLTAEVERDVLGTLRRLAALGYRAVEFAGIGDAMPAGLPEALGQGKGVRVGSGALSLADLRSTLDELGMRATSVHMGFPPAESIGLVAEYVQTLGAEYAVLAWVSEERRRTVADVKRLAEDLNSLSETLRAYGVQFAYHNHDFEFAPLEGQGPRHEPGSNFYEILALGTDPGLVKLELDLYWTAYAGQDPAELIRKHAGRVPLLHMKDMAAGEDRAMAAVGSGTLDWPVIVAAADTSGTKWFIVEHDPPVDAMRVAESSLRYLQALVG